VGEAHRKRQMATTFCLKSGEGMMDSGALAVKNILKKGTMISIGTSLDLKYILN
jgi:hypothetical protein